MSVDPNSEILDALPYYDDDLQKYPNLKQKVDRELARERVQTTGLHPRVPPPVDLFGVRERVLCGGLRRELI